MGTTTNEFWGVHSEKDGKPALRAWAKSEAEAKALVEQIKRSDADQAEDDYWVDQLSPRAVAGFKDSGFIPADA